MVVKKEIDEVEGPGGKKPVSINDIITGIQQCKIDNNVSNGSKDIADQLRNLNLEDDKVQKLQNVRVEVIKVKQDVSVKSCHAAMLDNLVKLEEPCPDDKEEYEESRHLKYEENEEKEDEEETCLEERGPPLGVAVHHIIDPSLNYIASKPCPERYQFQTRNLSDDFSIIPAMPPNFPCHGSQSYRVDQDKGSKREIDDREVYYESYKYIRPQNAGITEMAMIDRACMVPPFGLNNAAAKSVSQVIPNQMSGATVYSPENRLFPDDNIFHGHLNNQDQEEFKYFFDLEESLLDTDDFLPSSGPSSQIESLIDQQSMIHLNQIGGLNDLQNNIQMNQMPSKINMVLQEQQWHNSQVSQPPVNQLTNPYLGLFQQQKLENCHQQSIPESVCGKRGSFGNEDYCDGYVSDMSPSHDTQDASPCSVIGGSPPQSNWSRPPSNMSHASVDSGVCSPMADDHNGYSSMKSPRQGHSYSPQSTAPPTPQTRMISTSPPHQYTPPQHVTQQAIPQDKQIFPNFGEGYSNPWIDAHLSELDMSLEIARQDLMNHLQNNTSLSNKRFQTKAIVKNPSMDVYDRKVTHPPQICPVGVVPPTVTNWQDNMPTNQFCPNLGMKTTPQVNPFLQQQPQMIPNLPTTVPATIPINKNGIYQPSAMGIGQPYRKVPAVIANPVPVPQQAVPGKIAIPPINTKNKTKQNQNKSIPVLVTGQVMTNKGLVTPVLFMSPNVQQNPTQRKLQTIFPKEAAKQKEPDLKVSQTTANNPPPCNNGCEIQVKKSNVSPPTTPTVSLSENKNNTENKLLNLARRLVAGRSKEDIQYVDEDGDTYLHVAVCKSDQFLMQALLERLERENLIKMIDMQNSTGQTPLYLAVSTNHTKMVQLIIERGADVTPLAESITPTGCVEKNAAIHCACTKGEKYLETLRALLLAKGINVDQVNSDGHTPLICAILAHGKMTTDNTPVNSIPIIRALVQGGANLNLKVQQNGKTALMYALESRDLDLIESTFHLVEPQKLSEFLTTQAFDNSSCHKIAESFKTTLNPAGQQRLSSCLRPTSNRLFVGLAS